MKIVEGSVAYVSGAGSGIGRGLALALAARGVRVGVCDIRAEACEETARLIGARGGTALATPTDVSEPSAVEAAAEAIEATFGPVSLVFNNAGVAMHGAPVHEITQAEWDWVIGVNVYGVIHGLRAFVPRLKALGGPGHIVNTASIGGFQVNPAFLTGAYSATKFAVVALSEALRNELAGGPVGVSVLAPAAVDTGIHLSARSRPQRLGGPYERPQNHFIGELIKDGMAPAEIAARVLRAVEAGEFYIFTHPETRRWIEERHRGIMAAFDRLETAEANAETSAPETAD